ncbi:ATP-binding protein [Ramlibacter sp.]|uniref:ATP-binding protein n=1 Tax=Ramlibacter sp. TaxID=1917967 RepID=UPI003D105438
MDDAHADAPVAPPVAPPAATHAAPPPLRRARLGLGAWLAFAFSMVSILLTAVLIGVIQRTASVQIETGIGSNLAELAAQTTSRLDRSVFERHREVELLARRVARIADPALLQRELDDVHASYRYYAWIGVTDQNGVVRAASRGMLQGSDVRQRPWWREAIAGRNLGDVHEALLLAKLLGQQPGGEPLRFFDVAFALRDEAGAITGVLGAHVNWDWAKDARRAIFTPVGRRASVEPLIVATDGLVLLGPAGTEGGRMSLESLRLAARGEAGSTIEKWPDGNEYLVGYSRARGYETSPGLGWTVLVRQDLAEAYAPVRDLQKHVLASGIAIALLFSLLGWLMARTITRPLFALAHAARALEAGGSAPVKPSRAYREVQGLGQAINSLVGKLQANEAQLRDLNAGLEQRVAERTAELVDALASVRASERRVQTIIESAQDPFIGMDLEGRIIEWNTQAEVLFKWPREEILGRYAHETLVPARFAQHLMPQMRALAASGLVHAPGGPLERIMCDSEGRELPMELRLGVVEAGGTRFFFAFAYDLSDRKEVERLKNEFVSTVSHELRTPLTAIYGSLDLLSSGMAGDLPTDADELVRISHKSSERLLRLVDELLDVEKIASGKMQYHMERQPLRSLAQQALHATQAFGQRYGVELRLVGDADPAVLGDADRLVQVIVNLMSNAAKFSPRGGVVEMSLTVADGWTRLGVADNGAGIPPEFRGRIFERFAQADSSDRRAKGGTGLGLSICRSIVEHHGGRIDFTSEPGVRTEFFFELPTIA